MQSYDDSLMELFHKQKEKTGLYIPHECVECGRRFWTKERADDGQELPIKDRCAECIHELAAGPRGSDDA